MSEAARLIEAFRERPTPSVLAKRDLLLRLAQIDDPHIVPFLLAVVADRSEPNEVRIDALRWLSDGPRLAPYRRPVADAIMRLLSDGADLEVRLQATLAVAELTDVDGVLTTLGRLVLDSAETIDVRYAAFTSIEHGGPVGTVVGLATGALIGGAVDAAHQPVGGVRRPVDLLPGLRPVVAAVAARGHPAGQQATVDATGLGRAVPSCAGHEQLTSGPCLARVWPKPRLQFADTQGGRGLNVIPPTTLRTGEAVAVKVQRPTIAVKVNADLRVMAKVARVLERRVALAYHLQLNAMVEEFATGVRKELDFGNEAYHARRLAANMASIPAVHVPRIDGERSASRVLTMELIQGVKITDTAAIDQAGLDRSSCCKL